MKTLNKFGVLLVPFVIASVVCAQPSPSDRETHRAAMEACFQELGLQRPQRGLRPSEEDRQKLQNCLSQKGISMPHRPPAGTGRPPRGHWSDEPAPASTQ